MIYDQNELQGAVEQGERKLAERRQRARRQKRRTWIALGLLSLALVVAGLWASLRSAPLPAAPKLVVTWPKSKAIQVMASGQTIMAREGQPFQVAISEPGVWDVAWRSSSIENVGDSFEWAPQKDGETLIASCRVHQSGWRSLFPRATASQDLSLRAALPATSQVYRRTISLDKGSTWLLPFVEAKGSAAWDERALAALFESASVVPGAVAGAKLGGLNGQTSPATWRLVSDFNGGTGTPANDNATYASLLTPHLETTLPQVAAKLVQLAPQASIKWILRFDKDVPEGIVRMSFDGKQQRQAWIKRPNQNAGTPITGWEGGQWNGTLPPETPTELSPSTASTPAPTSTRSR